MVNTQFDCNLCGCRNGLLSCTRAPCQDEVADRCSTCKRSQQGLVCAPNGVTYRSECEAVFCAGHVPFTLQKGACKNYVSDSLIDMIYVMYCFTFLHRMYVGCIRVNKGKFVSIKVVCLVLHWMVVTLTN